MPPPTQQRNYRKAGKATTHRSTTTKIISQDISLTYWGAKDLLKAQACSAYSGNASIKVNGTFAP